jgi:putative nucleotidyltransferase with HDIG domain
MIKIRFPAIAGATAVAACAATVFLYSVSPPLQDGGLAALLILASLALIAEALSYLLPHGVRGSIAYIPYLASALIAPHWYAILAIVCVSTITQVVTKSRFDRGLFNVAQHALTLGVATLVYLGLGGESFITLTRAGIPASISTTTQHFGLPAISAYAVSFFVNTLIVSAGIAAIEGSTPLKVWRELKLSTIGIDLLASPIVFVFAWVFYAWGAMVAALVWVPIMGLRQVHKTNLELERTNEELLELMVKSMEARDPYTSGHSRRVQHYSTVIARVLGLTDHQSAQVSKAALLHDVGKIHEKYARLLAKADRLSQDDWTVMQEHSADGAELVATMTRLRELVTAIRHHHENWDGSGYPDGLGGDDIPLAARIIRFADTMDAMLTERPYRAALDYETVRAEVLRCRGTQFDPEMTDKLLASPGWATLFAPPAMPSRSFGLSLVHAERKRAGRA